jgi:hypothetical protein
MDVIPSFFPYYFIALAVSVGFYAVGHCLFAFFAQKEKEPYSAVFSRLTVGVIAVVTLFACLRTNGQTSLLGILFLSLYLLFIYLKDKEISFANWKRNILQWHFPALGIFALLLLISTLPFYLLLTDFNGQMLIPSNDYSFYATLSYKLANVGIESVNPHLSNFLQDSPSFYHYFELWFSALIYKIFGVSTMYAFLLVVCPVFVASTCLGALQLAKRLLQKNLLISFLISLAVLFVATFPLTIKSFSLNLFQDPTGTLILTKLGIVYVMVMWFFLQYKRENWEKNLLPFAFLSLLYSPTMPAIIVASLIFITILYLLKNIDLRQFGRLILLFLIPALYIPAFYALTSKAQPVEVFDSYLKNEGLAFYLKEMYLNGDGIQTFIRTFIKSFLNITLSLLPWAVLFLLFIDWKNLLKRHKELLLLLGLFFIVGLTGANLIFMQENAIQLYANLNNTAIALSIFLAILLLLKKWNKLIYPLIILNLLGFYFSYDAITKRSSPADKVFYNEIREELEGKNYTVAYIRDSLDYRQFDYQYQLWQKSINYTVPYPEIRRFSSSYTPVCLSIFDISVETPREVLYAASDIVSSPFYHFVYKEKLNNNITFAREKFLRENKIDYLIINKDNEWLKQANLPVRKVITGEKEKEQLVFFDWE